MAEKLSVQIALEGGAEVEAQLADIGKAGQKAFAQIEQSAAQVGGFKNLKPEEVTAQLKKMGVEGTAAVGKIQAAVATASKFEKLVLGVQSVENGFAAVKQAAVAAAPVIAGIGVVAAGALVAATKSTIGFAQSITAISTEAIKLGLSFQQFDDARKKLEAFGISAQGISAAFTHVQQSLERMRLEQVTRDAEAVKQGFSGSGAALERLKRRALEFTAAGDAAAQALRSMGFSIPGLPEADIRKFGIELTRLKTLVEQVTGQKIVIDVEADDAAAQMEAIKELLTQMPDGAQRTAVAFRLLGPAAAEFIQQLRLAEGSLSPVEANAIALTAAVNQLQAAFARFGSVSFAPFVTAEVNAVTSALQKMQAAVEGFSWGTFTEATIAAGNALKYFSIQGMVSLGLQWAWDLGGFDALIGKIQNAINWLMQLIGLKDQAGGTPLPGGAPIGGPGGGIGGAARGGLLGGRGTGTSDSNLAWVSRGEYVVPARAVRQSGVLGFLEALRRSGGNLSRALDGMGRFALGGMVPRAIPAFATGGLAGGSSNVTIQFPGLPDIGGLRASSSAVGELRKAAAMAQVRSGGRKPSRYS